MAEKELFGNSEQLGDVISRQAAIAYAISGRVRTLPTSEDGENWIRTEEVRQSLLTMPSAQQWIPCSERLPRQGQEVICQCRANMIKVLKLDADGDWYQDAEHCYMSGFVIAWMPIPEPYREDTP